MIIREKELHFFEEALSAFRNDDNLTTYRNDDDTYIALRTSFDFCRDSVMILESRNIATFIGVLPEAGPVVTTMINKYGPDYYKDEWDEE